MLSSCAADREGAAASTQQPEPAEIATSRDTYALGTTVTEEGAIPQAAEGEMFLRGNAVWLSVDVKSASTDQQIEVAWIGPHGETIRRDGKVVPQAEHYATFSTGPTTRWSAGEYKAVVVIDGRRVTERPFVLS